MSCPIEVDRGATKPILMLRASAEAAGFDTNSNAATLEIAMIAIITMASNFFCKLFFPFLSLLYKMLTLIKLTQ